VARKSVRHLSLLICLGLMAACGGTRPGEEAIDPDKAELIDVLTLFVEAVQADRYERAFSYLTSSEKARMLESGAEASPDVKRRLKALRLSTLAQKSTVRLQGGKVEGIYDQLPSLGPLPAGGREDSARGDRSQDVPTF
jgi:hypothetical protein